MGEVGWDKKCNYKSFKTINPSKGSISIPGDPLCLGANDETQACIASARLQSHLLMSGGDNCVVCEEK